MASVPERLAASVADRYRIERQADAEPVLPGRGGTNDQGNLLTGRVLHWSVSDESVMTTDGFGLITCVSPGIATVAVAVENVSATLGLTVQ